jgi:hypothetical protein
VAGINILGDCLPSPDNYLELSDELDDRRLPKPRVHFSAGENETRMTAHADRLMREIWVEAGAQDIWAYPRFAHVIGTCRMGADAETAVVDPDGESFDTPGLFIADNSTFPSALSANPVADHHGAQSCAPPTASSLVPAEETPDVQDALREASSTSSSACRATATTRAISTGRGRAVRLRLPTGAPGEFMFATGIECSYPTIDNGRTRRDLLEECGHYERWREDLGLIKELGLKVVRYGLPYHRTHLGPGPLRLELRGRSHGRDPPARAHAHPGPAALRRARLAGELPEPRAAGPLRRLRRRRRRALSVGALLHAGERDLRHRPHQRQGRAVERAAQDRQGLRHRDQALRRASILANHAIAARRPDCVIVQSESAEYIHEAKAVRSPEVTLANKQRFISLDLLYAHRRTPTSACTCRTTA